MRRKSFHVNYFHQLLNALRYRSHSTVPGMLSENHVLTIQNVFVMFINRSFLSSLIHIYLLLSTFCLFNQWSIISLHTALFLNPSFFQSLPIPSLSLSFSLWRELPSVTESGDYTLIFLLWTLYGNNTQGCWVCVCVCVIVESFELFFSSPFLLTLF